MNPTPISLIRLGIIVLALLLAAPSAAREVVSVDEFLQALDQVRSKLQEGKPRELDRDEWKDFDKIHGKFKRLLSDVETVDELLPREQTKVFNLQEELDTLLIGREDEQVVCTERKQLGSRIARRDCITISERRRLRDQAHELVTDFPSLMQPPAGN